MRDILREALSGCNDFVELRYHERVTRSLLAEGGRLERSSMATASGVGIRVLMEGTWGFAATGDLSLAGVRRCLEEARRSARASAAWRREKLRALPPARMARGTWRLDGYDELLQLDLEARAELVMGLESMARRGSSEIVSASARYQELREHTVILTSDGADAELFLVRPELRVLATASRDGQLQRSAQTVGVTGGWEALLRVPPEQMADRASREAVELLSAEPPEGGRATVILSPSIVGLMIHEAVGHTVEADMVRSGSVAAGKLGQRVASDLVTLRDGGESVYQGSAGGCIPVDDEGVLTQTTTVIEDGILKSYLHNRESAQHFGVEPDGSARAWSYRDEPLIRMRNTWLEPGAQSLEEILDSTEEGYIVSGPLNGQADSTGEFTFGVQAARRIHKGKLGAWVKGVTLTGQAFDVLQSVDAVSSDFAWELGAGYCGKGQPAKVDAGGPYLRCRMLLGGTQ